MLLSAALAACGGGGGGDGGTQTPPVTGSTQYSVGGTASGLSGSGLVLQDNGADDLTVSGNGAFTFPTKVNAGAAYNVSVKTQPSGQTCAVTNGSGTATADVTSVAVACTTDSTGGGTNVTVGGTVTGLTGSGLVLQNNAGDNLTVAQNGSFTFPTAVAPGSNYAVTVATQPSAPNQSCTVASGSGTAAANVTSVAITCRTIGQAAFVANYGSATVQSFSIDPTSGGLTAAQAPVTVGQHPAAVSLAPNGKFAFTATDNGQNIYAFTVDPNGTLHAVNSGTPFPNTAFKLGHPYPDIAVDPQSKFLYLASYNDGVVAGFAIDQNTGALTPITGTDGVPAGAGAGGIPAFSPDGNYLYVVNQGVGNVLGTTGNANTISVYKIDQTTGALTAVGTPVPTGNPADPNHGAQPIWIAFTPNGKFAYVSNTGQASVSTFSVGSDGSLTQLGTPQLTGGHPYDLTIDTAGAHLYVPNRSEGTIAVFSIDPNSGALSVVGDLNNPVHSGAGPMFVQIEATGRFAYVASSAGSDIYAYSIDPNTGALVPLTPTPNFPAGMNPNFVNIDPSGKFLYAGNSGSTGITAYTIDPTSGGLSPIAGSPNIPSGGNQPFFVSISPEAPGIRD